MAVINTGYIPFKEYIERYFSMLQTPITEWLISLEKKIDDVTEWELCATTRKMYITVKFADNDTKYDRTFHRLTTSEYI